MRATVSKRRMTITDEAIQIEHNGHSTHMCSMIAGARAEIAQDGLADTPAELMAVDIGTAEVNSAPDARIADFLGNGGGAIERACHSKHRRTRDAHPHAVRLEVPT